MKLKQHLFLAITITVLLTIALVARPGGESGYGGLFFLLISPVVGVAFLLWGLILQSLAQRRKWLGNIFSYMAATLLALLIVLFGILTLSSDRDIQSISYSEIFLDQQVLLFLFFTALAYGFLFWFFKKA